MAINRGEGVGAGKGTKLQHTTWLVARLNALGARAHPSPAPAPVPAPSLLATLRGRLSRLKTISGVGKSFSRWHNKSQG